MKKKLVFVMTADGKSEGNRALAIHFASKNGEIFSYLIYIVHSKKVIYTSYTPDTCPFRHGNVSPREGGGGPEGHRGEYGQPHRPRRQT